MRKIKVNLYSSFLSLSFPFFLSFPSFLSFPFCLEIKWMYNDDYLEHNTKDIYQRIVQWFELEGALEIILFQAPCHEQGHFSLYQVSQNPIEVGLSHQGWGNHIFSEQPLLVPHPPHRKEFLSIANLNVPSFSLKTSPLVLLL